MSRGFIGLLIAAAVTTAVLAVFNPRLALLALGSLASGTLATAVWRHRSGLRGRWPQSRWLRRLAIPLVVVLSFGVLLVSFMLGPAYVISPGTTYQVPYKATLTLTGEPETWSVTETFAFGAPNEDSALPEGWVQERPVGDVHPISHTRVLTPSLGDLSQLRLTSITTFQPNYLSVYPDLYIPENGSVVTVIAPRGTIVDTHPDYGSADVVPGSDLAETKIPIIMGALDAVPPAITLETTPSWGRDPNLGFLWTLSVSSIIGFGLSLFWAVVGGLLQAGGTEAVKRGWRRLRSARAAPAPEVVGGEETLGRN